VLRLISVLLILVGLGLAGVGGVALMGTTLGGAPPVSASAPESAGGAAPPPPSRALARESEAVFSTESRLFSAADRLREVPIAHETPDLAVIGEAFEVTLAIDATGAESAARVLPGRGDVVAGSAMVGREAKALLSGANFDIEPLSPDLQALSEFAANTWRWRVTAEAAGPQDLVLDIFAMDGGSALPVHSFRDTVTIQVSTVGRLVRAANEANPLVVLLGGIGSILGGAFGVFRFFRK